MTQPQNGDNNRAEHEIHGPLSDIRVLELGSTIAGPFCGRLFADFGADVVKIEPFEGDSVRNLGRQYNGVSLYGASILRNKKLISVNLKSSEGVDIVKKLVANTDIFIENFRPGTLEQLGLAFETLAAINPALIMVRISGYGQSGPLSKKAGYGVVAEAFGGVRHLTGDPDRPPTRSAVALTDQFTALYAVFGALAALHHRQKSGRGQVVDAALYESAFSLMEPHVPAYEKDGTIPMRTGSAFTGSAPNNLYPTADGANILIAANNDSVFNRLAKAIGRVDLLQSTLFNSQKARAENCDAIDAEISDWTMRHQSAEIESILDQNGVPASKILTIADIFNHPHHHARQMLERVKHSRLGSVTLAGIVPKLSETPGAIRWAGGAVGEHTVDVLAQTLGYSPQYIAELIDRGVICSNKDETSEQNYNIDLTRGAEKS